MSEVGLLSFQLAEIIPALEAFIFCFFMFLTGGFVIIKFKHRFRGEKKD